MAWGKEETFPTQHIGGSVTLNHVGGEGDVKGKDGRQTEEWMVLETGGAERSGAHYTGGKEHKVLLIILHFSAVLACCYVRSTLGCFLANIFMHLIVHAIVILFVHVSLKGAHIGTLEAEFIMCP